MNGPAGSGASPAPHDALTLVRRLYDAWNAGDVAAAARLLSPAVRWETFGGPGGALSGPEGLQTTLAGAPSGGTWHRSPVTVDVLVRVVEHVIAVSRRRGPDGERERLEVWTLRDGAVVHYRGFPLDEGLAVLTETTGSRRLEAVCRAVLAFNRGDADEWVELLDPGLAERWRPGQRLDDVEILAESASALVITAVQHLEDATRSHRVAESLHLVIAFAGGRARRVSGYPTAEDALAAAR